MHEGKTKGTYYPWADWVKVLGIFLVVLGHGITPKDGLLFQWIYSFHMPLFFLLSGLLSAPKGLIATLKSGFFSLIIPYLIINVICLVFESTRIMVDGGLVWNFVRNSLCAILLGINTYAFDIRPVCHYSWFLMALFLIKIITSASSNRNYQVILTIVSGIIGFLLSMNHIDTFVPVDSAILALPFYTVGNMSRRLKDILPQYVRGNRNLIALCLLIGNSFLSSKNGNVDINYMSFGNNILLFYLNGITISISILVLMQNIKTIPINFQTFAKGTILIMGIHHIVYYWVILRITLAFAPSIKQFPYMANIFISIVTLITLFPILKLCELYFPAAIGYRKRLQ